MGMKAPGLDSVPVTHHCLQELSYKTILSTKNSSLITSWPSMKATFRNIWQPLPKDQCLVSTLKRNHLTTSTMNILLKQLEDKIRQMFCKIKIFIFFHYSNTSSERKIKTQSGFNLIFSFKKIMLAILLLYTQACVKKSIRN